MYFLAPMFACYELGFQESDGSVGNNEHSRGRQCYVQVASFQIIMIKSDGYSKELGWQKVNIMKHFHPCNLLVLIVGSMPLFLIVFIWFSWILKVLSLIM